jgi:hypothetical protein
MTLNVRKEEEKMKKSIITIAAITAIAELIAKNPIEISSPSLHLPNKQFGTIETNVTITIGDKNPKNYDNDLWHETVYNIFSAHVCNNGDCFTGIELSRSEVSSCNIYGNCDESNIYDFWATKGEDDFWLNFEIGF